MAKFSGRCLYPLIPVGGLVKFENLNQMARVIVLLTILTRWNRLLVKMAGDPAIGKVISLVLTKLNILLLFNPGIALIAGCPNTTEPKRSLTTTHGC